MFRASLLVAAVALAVAGISSALAVPLQPHSSPEAPLLANQLLPAEASDESLESLSVRHKRSFQPALDLSLSHTDSEGNDRPVGQVCTQ